MDDALRHVKNLRRTVEQETEYGVYVWKMPDGRYLSDGKDNLLSINSRQHDFSRMAKLQQVVRSFGIDEGEPHYLPDRYKITDEEYDLQRERMENGIMPDPADPGNLGLGL